MKWSHFWEHDRPLFLEVARHAHCINYSDVWSLFWRPPLFNVAAVHLTILITCGHFVFSFQQLTSSSIYFALSLKILKRFGFLTSGDMCKMASPQPSCLLLVACDLCFLPISSGAVPCPSPSRQTHRSPFNSTVNEFRLTLASLVSPLLRSNSNLSVRKIYPVINKIILSSTFAPFAIWEGLFITLIH